MKLVTAVVAPEVCFVFGRKKRTLMVVEPPGEFIGGAIFEINDDILGNAELVFGDVLPRLVGQPFVFDFRFGVDVRPIKAGKHCGR